MASSVSVSAANDPKLFNGDYRDYTQGRIPYLATSAIRNLAVDANTFAEFAERIKVASLALNFCGIYFGGSCCEHLVWVLKRIFGGNDDLDCLGVFVFLSREPTS